MAEGAPWPELPYAAWASTLDTLHMWTQVVGKVRLALSPYANHWWHVPLYVASRGLTTTAIPCEGGVFEMTFDFISHQLSILKSDGALRTVALAPRTVADFHAEVMATLKDMNIHVRIWTMPQEFANPIAFEKDVTHRSYDPAYATRFWNALLSIDAVLKEFRGGFIGKCSPVHFFWGSFDLAVTRFSGRRAALAADVDPVTREAYSHEVASVGWWPGDASIPYPCFYAYAAPEPAGYGAAKVGPAAAYYNRGMSQFHLKYDDVRRATDPRGALLEFCRSTYGAAADLGHWDRAMLERQAGY
jgi:hypothetical protein